MQNIISELIIIEHAANERLREADAYAEALPLRIEEEKKRIKQDIWSKDTDKAKAEAEKILTDTQNGLMRIESEYRNKLEHIQNIYNGTHESLCDAIFLRVIGKNPSLSAPSDF